MLHDIHLLSVLGSGNMDDVLDDSAASRGPICCKTDDAVPQQSVAFQGMCS